VAGGDYTAKDVRTWSATVLAAARLATVGASSSRTGRRRAVAAAVRDVYEHLGGTPVGCPGSRIAPRALHRSEHGETIGPLLAAAVDSSPLDVQRARSRVDAAVVALLDGEPAAHGRHNLGEADAHARGDQPAAGAQDIRRR
jgi:DNA topoisomerase-1